MDRVYMIGQIKRVLDGLDDRSVAELYRRLMQVSVERRR